jgi:hypothetical protein
MRQVLCSALTISAATLSAGCAGSQPPIGPLVTMQQAPLARGRGEVQYFSNFYGSGTPLEFDYPKSDSPIESIAFSGGSFCTKGARTFWVVGSSGVSEFKVGGEAPIGTLKTGDYTSDARLTRRLETLQR